MLIVLRIHGLVSYVMLLRLHLIKGTDYPTLGSAYLYYACA